MGKWTLGTGSVQGKGKALSTALGELELPVDDDLEVDEGAQAQLDAARKAIETLASSPAFEGLELHVTANGYAARGGKRASELPTSYLSITVSAIDPKTDAPRTWVESSEPDPDPAPAAVVGGES